MNWKYIFYVEKMPVTEDKPEYLVFIDDDEAMNWILENIDEYVIWSATKNSEWKDRELD